MIVLQMLDDCLCATESAAFEDIEHRVKRHRTDEESSFAYKRTDGMNI